MELLNLGSSGPIVQTNSNYTYETLMSDLYELNTKYSFIQIQNTGYSVLGRTIPVIRLGRGTRQVFYSASIHANEWITSVLLMKFIEDYCRAYISNSTIRGYNIRNIFNTTSIYIMPMVNPDGIGLIFTGAVKACLLQHQYAVHIGYFLRLF